MVEDNESKSPELIEEEVGFLAEVFFPDDDLPEYATTMSQRKAFIMGSTVDSTQVDNTARWFYNYTFAGKEDMERWDEANTAVRELMLDMAREVLMAAGLVIDESI